MFQLSIPNLKSKAKDPDNWLPMQPARKVRVPLWRRVISLALLVCLNVVAGVAVAAVIGGTALLALVLVERAVG